MTCFWVCFWLTQTSIVAPVQKAKEPSIKCSVSAVETQMYRMRLGHFFLIDSHSLINHIIMPVWHTPVWHHWKLRKLTQDVLLALWKLKCTVTQSPKNHHHARVTSIKNSMQSDDVFRIDSTLRNEIETAYCCWALDSDWSEDFHGQYITGSALTATSTVVRFFLHFLYDHSN